MCKILRIARSTYYYEVKVIPDESDLYEAIQQTFQENREVYGARKLKKALEKKANLCFSAKNYTDYERARSKVCI